MAKTGRESAQQMLRLTDELRDRLRRIAEENGRSLNAEIVQRLEESLQHADSAERISRLELEKKHLVRLYNAEYRLRKASEKASNLSLSLLHIYSKMIRRFVEGDRGPLERFVEEAKTQPEMINLPMPNPLEDEVDEDEDER